MSEKYKDNNTNTIINNNTNQINQEKENNFTNKKPLCNICKSYDEFSICQKCFDFFNEKTNNQKKSTLTHNQELKKIIQTFLDKRKFDIEKYNKIKAKKLKIENYKKKINEKTEKIKELKSLKENLLEKKEKNLKIFLDFEEKIKKLNEINTINEPNFISIKQSLIKKISEKENKTKKFIRNLLELIFNKKIYSLEEIFEKDEYVIPSMNYDSHKNQFQFDQFSNILSSENIKFNKGAIEDNKIYEKFLKTKDSIVDYKINPFPFSKKNENFNANEKDYFNRCFIFEVNSYVYKVILFEKILADFLKIKLPYDFIGEEFIIFSEIFGGFLTQRNLIVSDYYNKFDENETFAAFTLLNKNFCFLLNFLGVKFNSNNNNRKFEKEKKINKKIFVIDNDDNSNNNNKFHSNIGKDLRNFDVNVYFEENFLINFLDMGLFFNYSEEEFVKKKFSDFFFNEENKKKGSSYDNDNDKDKKIVITNTSDNFELIEKNSSNNIAQEDNSFGKEIFFDIESYIIIDDYFEHKLIEK